MHIGVIGGGIFGMATALELRSRGHEVTLCERGTIPAADASSTDVSKAIRRIHYPEEEYIELVTQAAQQWVTGRSALAPRFIIGQGFSASHGRSPLKARSMVAMPPCGGWVWNQNPFQSKRPVGAFLSLS